MPRINDRIGPYQLSKKLGKGGFGEVWLAKNVTALVSRNLEVALKIPHDEDVDLDAIKQEAAIWLAASGHDNVLPFIEANVYEDYVVFVRSGAGDDARCSEWTRTFACPQYHSSRLEAGQYVEVMTIIQIDLPTELLKAANVLMNSLAVAKLRAAELCGAPLAEFMEFAAEREVLFITFQMT